MTQNKQEHMGMPRILMEERDIHLHLHWHWHGHGHGYGYGYFHFHSHSVAIVAQGSSSCGHRIFTAARVKAIDRIRLKERQKRLRHVCAFC